MAYLQRLAYVAALQLKEVLALDVLLRKGVNHRAVELGQLQPGLQARSPKRYYDDLYGTKMNRLIELNARCWAQLRCEDLL